MDKAPDAFRTISEVAQELDVPQHVLRFWESRFREIKPMKRGGGRRYYRPNDLDLLRGIRHLLYSEGYTIRGVQRLLIEQAVDAGEPRLPLAGADEGERSEQRFAPPAPRAAAPPPAGLAREDLQKLQAALRELTECRRLLEAALTEGT